MRRATVIAIVSLVVGVVAVAGPGIGAAVDGSPVGDTTATAAAAGTTTVEDAALAPAGSPLALADAESMALAASPSLRAAAARIRAEEGRLRQAGLYPNLELGIDANWFTHDFVPRETLLNFRQPIPYHGKRGLEQEEARERIETARADADRERLDVLQRVREAYYRLGFAGRIRDVAQQNLEAARAMLAAVQARVAAGDAAAFEALKASVEVSRAESDLRQVDGEREAQTAVFNLLLGLPPGSPTRVADPVAAAPPTAGMEELVQRALGTQPEIRAREHAALAAGAAADRARLEPRPDIAVGPTFGVDQGDTLVGLGLSLRLPLWNRYQGLIESAAAARDEAAAAVDAARLSVSSQVADALGRWRAASRLQQMYEQGPLAEADRLVELTRESYEAGASGTLDLLDARRTALSVKMEYFRASLDAALAAVRLRRAIGVDSETPPGGNTP